jgi:hypothetical protein
MTSPSNSDAASRIGVGLPRFCFFAVFVEYKFIIREYADGEEKLISPGEKGFDGV